MILNKDKNNLYTDFTSGRCKYLFNKISKNELNQKDYENLIKNSMICDPENYSCNCLRSIYKGVCIHVVYYSYIIMDKLIITLPEATVKGIPKGR